MKRVAFFLVVVLALVAVSVVYAGGIGELMASFRAGISGGFAIDVHSDVAADVASPQSNPEGRLEPFGTPEFICDQLVVGTWIFVLDPDRDVLDAFTNEFKLDGNLLDTVRTPNKRITQGAGKGWWWFAEGVPVLGVLDPGLYDLEWSFDDGFGNTDTSNTDVDVHSDHC